MRALRDILVGVFIILLPFEDTALRGILMNLGGSFAVLPLMGLVVLEFLNLATTRRSLSVNWTLLQVGAYCFLVTAMYIAALGTWWYELWLPAKALRLAVSLSLAMFVIFGIKWKECRAVGPCVRIAFLIALGGVLVGDLDILGLGWLVQNPILRATPLADTRWRGLCTEASALSLSISALGFLSAHFAPSKRAAWCTALVTTTVVVLSASKGGLASLLAAGAAVLVLTRRVTFRTLLWGVVAIPVIYRGYQLVLDVTAQQAMAEQTTFGTRATLFVWGAIVIAHNPLGVGFGGFYHMLSVYLGDAISVVDQISGGILNFSEVSAYAGSDLNASSKSTILNLGIYFGLPALICMFSFFRTVLKACLIKEHFYLLGALCVVVIAHATYSESLVAYASYVVCGVAWHERQEAARIARR